MPDPTRRHEVSSDALHIGGTGVLADLEPDRDPVGERPDVGHHAHHPVAARSEEHTSELQSRENLVCRLLLEKQKLYDHSLSAAQTDTRNTITVDRANTI